MAKLRPTYAFAKRLEFLSSGKLYLKDSVKVITFMYNMHGSNSHGIRQFVKEQLPPIQFKHPNIQFSLIKNRKPTPSINIYLSDDRYVTLDVENKEPELILSELASVAGVPDSEGQEAVKQRTAVNSANFAESRTGRRCICEVPGQRPCPSKVPFENIKHSWHDKNSSLDDDTMT